MLHSFWLVKPFALLYESPHYSACLMQSCILLHHSLSRFTWWIERENKPWSLHEKKNIFSWETPCCYLKIFYSSNKPHFLWVFQHNKRTLGLRRTHPKGFKSSCFPIVPFTCNILCCTAQPISCKLIIMYSVCNLINPRRIYGLCFMFLRLFFCHPWSLLVAAKCPAVASQEEVRLKEL